jgi:transcription termination/antitermination protein NusA
VEIVAIAREAGHRTKIAVRSHQSGVNAKGACIGPMGSRVRNVMTELHGEKIDIVDYADDPANFVANALSPARVNRVHVVDLAAREAQVIVPDYQLSLAIGKEGQNARLAARLTGWRIDIRSDAAVQPAPEAAEAAEAAETPETPETAETAETPETAAAAAAAAAAPETAAAAAVSEHAPDASGPAQVSPGVGDVRTR